MHTARCLSLLLALWPCARAAGQGLPLRGSPDDYSVHQNAPNAAIGANRLKPDQAAKIFSSDVARNYVIVEVALYPKGGTTIDVRLFDFGLRFGGEQETRPDTPEEAAVPWHENRGVPSRIQTTEEAGVFVATQKDPVTGRRVTNTGTYERVGVAAGAPPDQRFPDPPRGPDPRILEDRLRARALPEGNSTQPVAGYLYFPQPPKKAKDSKLDLTYSKDGSSVMLPLPAK
jgi:hypothetical protein